MSDTPTTADLLAALQELAYRARDLNALVAGDESRYEAWVHESDTLEDAIQQALALCGEGDEQSEAQEAAELYVIVNTSNGPSWVLFQNRRWFYVMPGEEPHTYGSLAEAVEAFHDLVEENGHDSFSIFRLALVSQTETDSLA